MASLATAILRGLTSSAHLDELLSRGAEVADLSYCDPLGRQLIHLAADCGDVSGLRWLLSRGAGSRAVTIPEGNTPLHLAASEGHIDVVVFLLEEMSVGVAGVNVAGETALDVALTAGHDDIVRLMTRHLRPLPLPPPQQQQQQQQQKLEATPVAATSRTAATVATAITTKHGGSPRPHDAENQSKTLNRLSQQQVRDVTEEFSPAETGDATTCININPVAVGASGTRMESSKGPTTPPAPSEKTKVIGGRTPPFDGRGVTEGGFFVAGAWSKAGVCSCFNVRHRNLLGKHGIVFDMGVCPSEVLHSQHVFITHGHLDHCGAAVSHARLRALSQGPSAKYYMHADLAAGMDKIRRAFEEVEGDSIPMNIVVVGPGDSVDLGQGCFVRPFLVKHRVEALGFALIRRKSGGLKHEYRDKDGKALGTLKKQGVEVTLFHESVEVVYTGDTVMSALASLPLVWRARLLIMEVTYLGGDGAAAAKYHHIHVQDVLDNVEKLEGVEQLVVAHVSGRHGVYRNVMRLLAAALPSHVINKVSVALGEFGAPQHLTFLEDYLLDDACLVGETEKGDIES